jgi:hypothetical protein
LQRKMPTTIWKGKRLDHRWKKCMDLKEIMFKNKIKFDGKNTWFLGSQHFRPPSYIDNSTYFQKINDITFNLECNQSCYMCPNVILMVI